MRDPYSILGVKRDADSDEIKAAWRSKAKTVHPDHNRDDPDANARFTEIGQAYDLLKDPKKRGLYDQARRASDGKQREQTIMQKREAAREAARQAAERAKAAEKLMEELARAQARNEKATAESEEGPSATTTSGSTKPETPEDMLERIFGAEAKVKGGVDSGKSGVAGSAEDASAQETAEAGNSVALGFFNALIRRFKPAPPIVEKAPDMTAEAIVTVSDIIAQKQVTLRMPDERDVRFQLPVGATDGHVVRLKGQGLKLPDAPRGDLVVTVLTARDDAFTVKGYDIHTSLPIALADAVLGCEAKVQSPRGEQQLSVPAWSGSDKAIHVPGKGLQKDDGTFGDLVVELRIVLLETPDAKVTDLMRHMREGLYL
ncbi:DnaJ C-terminal domain-containing protein [Rhizobium rhizogenes]|uniref:Molecular chaperone DnaJ n=1 Tax=Rhizobium rhizogenes TaxID=359 RepID=A0AA92BZC1_RHIRH|nr:DnaJ C-terminal domain-containing protein [Rhizobium rhizogenes]PVE50083.1 molecular chaperone DnaJ [Rhizobium rhizogenes]PVE63882.1 molecular chaperone DnaJ [Agrobacterium tumefaciens]PVE73145.1 molecular chaperone DnaJ [Sphingomonas sp. TPD3009]